MSVRQDGCCLREIGQVHMLESRLTWVAGRSCEADVVRAIRNGLR